MSLGSLPLQSAVLGNGQGQPLGMSGQGRGGAQSVPLNAPWELSPRLVTRHSLQMPVYAAPTQQMLPLPAQLSPRGIQQQSGPSARDLPSPRQPQVSPSTPEMAGKRSVTVNVATPLQRAQFRPSLTAREKFAVAPPTPPCNEVRRSKSALLDASVLNEEVLEEFRDTKSMVQELAALVSTLSSDLQSLRRENQYLRARADGLSAAQASSVPCQKDAEVLDLLRQLLQPRTQSENPKKGGDSVRQQISELLRQERDPSASSSSLGADQPSGWQKVQKMRRDMGLLNVLGRLLDDVRGNQLEKLYDSDWGAANGAVESSDNQHC